ncbi:MAG: acylphosphatase [Bacteroidetes bacterium]|nr:acylphosphatase [Bacteroidota bacterium]
MKKSFAIVVFGRVQGVGFRYHTLNKASELDIRGFVRNQADGTVYIEAEGDGVLLETFIDWCRQGPRWASVESVELKELDLRNYDGFTVK